MIIITTANAVKYYYELVTAPSAAIFLFRYETTVVFSPYLPPIRVRAIIYVGAGASRGHLSGFSFIVRARVPKTGKSVLGPRHRVCV